MKAKLPTIGLLPLCLAVLGTIGFRAEGAEAPASPRPNIIIVIAGDMDFPGVHVVIRNLDVRTYDNPRIGSAP